MSNRFQLFVYGNLKTGYPLNDCMIGSTYIGDVKTAPHYRLLHLGGAPGLIEVLEGGKQIEGELWEVNIRALAQLDQVEGHPRLYVRKLIQLSDKTWVFAYVWQHPYSQDLIYNGTCW